MFRDGCPTVEDFNREYYHTVNLMNPTAMATIHDVVHSLYVKFAVLAHCETVPPEWEEKPVWNVVHMNIITEPF